MGIVIFDNPANLNHPPRWHSRDYGLFAVNPFGAKEFDPAAAPGGYAMQTGEQTAFPLPGGDSSGRFFEEENWRNVRCLQEEG